MTYDKLFDAYKKCYSGEYSKQKIQNDVNMLWKSFKLDKKSLSSNVEKKVLELLQLKTKKDAVRLSFFTKQVSCDLICISNNDYIIGITI